MLADRLPAVILAGGLSRRMGGGDKALLPLGEGTLLSHVINRIGAQAGALALNANGDPARFGEALPVLPDTIADYPGPLAGILAAMEWAHATGAQQVVTVACDTPFLPDDLILRLSARQREAGVSVVLAATKDAGRDILHPTFGLWSTTLAGPLRGEVGSGTRRVREFAERAGLAVARFAGEAFFNVNTPDDLAEARRRLAECRV